MGTGVVVVVVVVGGAVLGANFVTWEMVVALAKVELSAIIVITF